MANQVLTKTQYSKLLKDVRKLIEDGRVAASRAVAVELVKMYWEIGKRIDREHLTENAGYGEAVLEDLSDELNIDIGSLHRSVQFFHTYKSATSSENLTWSHYKYLFPIKEEKEREFYQELADQEGLSVLELSKAIKNDRYLQTQKSSSTKQVGLKRPVNPAYVYKAYVEKVVDGDTLLLRFDLGFAVFKEQRVRLAHIDTEALDTNLGKAAYDFVVGKLAKAPFVVVKTNKIDIYGRYVGDVFYSFKKSSIDEVFTQGTYLNQELINQKLAKRL